jgi:hypothetical protein
MMGEEMSLENLAAFEQMRQEIPPSEFSNDLLDSAQEADPVAVAEFRAELQDLALPPEVLDVLDQLTDEVLASPDMYPQIRAKYLAQDIPEDLLPPTFDPEFFGALNLAVDQIRATTNMPMPPRGFARGGIASLNPIAAAMAQQGRYGDTMLAHISPREAAMLKDMGGSGTINPMTGMPEFFIKKIFKGAKKALKKVGKAVKKFASSSVGKIVTTMALAFFLGPAAATAMGVSSTAGVAAVSGFVGTAGSTALGGGSLKESLRAGALGGLTAGAGAGLLGGAQAFQAGSYTGPTTIGGQFTKAKEFFTGAPTDAIPTPTDATTFAAEQPAPSLIRTPIEAQGVGSLPQAAPEFTVDMTRGAPGLSQQARAAGMYPAQPAESGIFKKGLDKILPGRIESAAQEGAFQKVADQFGGTAEQIQAALSAPNPSPALVEAYKKAATPGMIRQYGPIAAAGLGIAGLAGAFKEEEIAPPEGFEGFMSGISPGQRLLDEDPQRYGISYGGVSTTSTTPQYSPYTYRPPQPRGAKDGGSMDKEFPRKNGPINGPGTGTSDDIPAMLSDGEFVFTAKAVRGMGDGSRRKGAQRMYALMRKLEGRKNG